MAPESTDQIEERVDELKKETSLSSRQAEVRARQENGYSHQEIADELDITKSTVDEYSRRINERIEDRDDDLHPIEKVPVDDIESACLSCGIDLGDEPPLADFPVCESCYRKMLKKWFDTQLRLEVRASLSETDIDRMIDNHIGFLEWANKIAVKLIAEQMEN